MPGRSKIDWKKVEKEAEKIYQKTAPSFIKKKLVYWANKDYADRTKKYARGLTMTSGEKHEKFDAEAAIYVWHEKNVLKLPKWLVGTKFNTGHASMRLSRFNDNTQEHEIVHYFSWWPESADKNTPPQPGALTSNTGEDRVSEMAGDEDLRLIVKMQLLRQALIKTVNGAQEFEELCVKRWVDLGSSTRDRLKTKYQVGDFFFNLPKSTVQAKANQKLLNIERIVNRHCKGKYSKDIIPTTNVADTLDKKFDSLIAVKQPYCKVYIPCSSPPVPLYDAERYQRSTVWGLSLYAMELATRFYEKGVTLYKMKGFDDNCVGAVWTVLKAGLADSISDNFKSTKGPIRNFSHLLSLLPSDAINASIAVMDDVLRRTGQQFFLDTHAQKHRQALVNLSSNNECFGRDWRMYVLNPVWWRDLSDARGMRPPKKRKVDDLVAKYAKLESGRGNEGGQDAARMIELEQLWERGKKDREELKKTIDDLNDVRSRIRDSALMIMEIRRALPQLRAGKSVPSTHILPSSNLDPSDLADLIDEMKRLQGNVKKYRLQVQVLLEKKTRLENRVESNTKKWEKELNSFERQRRAKARALTKLHDAIFDYIYSCGSYGVQTPDRRYLAVLLLGQFVAWMYAELADPNLKLGFHGMNEKGFILIKEERDRRLRLEALTQRREPMKKPRKGKKASKGAHNRT